MKLGFGDVGAYDFFKYGDVAYDAVASPEHTMALYSAKLHAYLEAEASKPQSAAARPFLLVAALQSMHVPLPDPTTSGQYVSRKDTRRRRSHEPDLAQKMQLYRQRQEQHRRQEQQPLTNNFTEDTAIDRYLTREEAVGVPAPVPVIAIDLASDLVINETPWR